MAPIAWHHPGQKTLCHFLVYSATRKHNYVNYNLPGRDTLGYALQMLEDFLIILCSRYPVDR